MLQASLCCYRQLLRMLPYPLHPAFLSSTHLPCTQATAGNIAAADSPVLTLSIAIDGAG